MILLVGSQFLYSPFHTLLATTGPESHVVPPNTKIQNFILDVCICLMLLITVIFQRIDLLPFAVLPSQTCMAVQWSLKPDQNITFLPRSRDTLIV